MVSAKYILLTSLLTQAHSYHTEDGVYHISHSPDGTQISKRIASPQGLPGRPRRHESPAPDRTLKLDFPSNDVRCYDSSVNGLDYNGPLEMMAAFTWPPYHVVQGDRIIAKK